jgi:hypothetical protein
VTGSDTAKNDQFASLGRLGRYDLIQFVLGLVLGVAIFLPWYSTEPSNPFSNIDGERGDLSAWQVHSVLRWVLVAAVIANCLGTWYTLRAQKTQVARGEQTIIIGTFVLGAILFVGLLDRPGTPQNTISLEYGWYLAAAATLGAVVCGLARAPGRRDRPPGVG